MKTPNQASQRDMRILIAIDLSDATETIVNKAETFAKRLSAQVWLVHVAESKVNPLELAFDASPQEERDLLAKGLRDEHCQVQEIAARLRHEGLVATAMFVQGDTINAILTKAKKLEVDMIVVGSHGKGMMAQLFVSSVSQGVLSRANCPVLVVPAMSHSASAK
ncbi:MAG: universal stress protein [Phormidesmis sp.]